jgi:hypothetical protein
LLEWLPPGADTQQPLGIGPTEGAGLIEALLPDDVLEPDSPVETDDEDTAPAICEELRDAADACRRAEETIKVLHARIDRLERGNG